LAKRSDRELLSAFCSSGDRAAMEELVLRHQQATYGLAWRILGNSQDACDAVQEATLRIMRGARSFRGDGSVAGWMRKAAASAALDLARRRERRSRHEKAVATEGGGEEMLNETERAEALGVLQEELAALPARLRTAAVLRYAESMSDGDAASALGWSRRTFSSRASQAMARLRERFRLRRLGGAVALIPVLVGEAPVPAAPGALAAALKTTVTTGKLAAPFWWLSLLNGGKAMIVKPGLGAACALSLALLAAAATFEPQVPAAVGGASARAAQPAAAASVPAPKKSAPKKVVGVASPVPAPAPTAAAPAGRPVRKVAIAGAPRKAVKPEEDVAAKLTTGALRVLRPNGFYAECPLKHTDVKADISGFIARVNVVQTFVNPTEEKIEAVYVFPLPHNSAVDSMTMHVAGRKIVGVIKRKAVAEEIYQQAIRQGATAAVLHQHRPNVFQQKVGNIPPNGSVRIQISYVDVLEYDRGEYAFHFPMVVGPRYTPAYWKEDARTGGGAPGGVNDAIRSGKSVSLSLKLDAGVPVKELRSVNHKVDMKQTGISTASCAIAAGDRIPNKDFDLRYKVIGKKPEMAVLAHQSSGSDGHFMLMIQPAEDELLKKAPPREVIFLVDVSGSMGASGIGHSKMAMQHFLKLSKPGDKIQIITFRNTATKCFESSVPCTEENVKKAGRFVDAIRAGGGTEMYRGVKEALNAELDPQRVRIVVMLTDALIGNGPQIVQEVGRKCGDRIRLWCIGVGPRVNRNLVDAVAKQGGGMGKILSKNESRENVHRLVNEVVERIHRAQLAAVRINWGGLKVYETYPARIPELWHGRPIVVHGRYTGGGQEQIRVSGQAEGKPVSWPLTVKLPEKEAGNGVLATVWARKKIESLMDQIWVDGSPQMIEEVTRIALEHKLMSQYTSFVAVDESTRVDDPETPVKPPVRLPLPVPLGQCRIGWGRNWRLERGAEGKAEEQEVLRSPVDAAKMPSPPPAAKPGVQGAPRPVLLIKGGYAARANRKMRKTGASRSGPGGIAGGGKGGGYRRGGRAYTYGKKRTKEKASHEDLLADADGEDREGLARLGRGLGDGGFLYYGIRQNLGDASKTGVEKAEVLLEAARQENDAAKKMALLQRAFLYDSSWRSLGWQTKGVVEKARAEIVKLREQMARDRVSAQPRLKTRLKLIVRDKSLREALGEIAAAAGLDLDLAPGAVAVASRLQDVRSLRVTWVDLRGATAAQAFDWLCGPAHIDWSVDGGKVRATVASLGRVEAPWTYDVSAVAMPLEEEFKDLKGDWKRIRRRSRELASGFMAEIRKTAGTGVAEDCFWLNPGQIVVFGDWRVHARVRRCLEELAAGRGEHGELGKKALNRYGKRRDYMEKSRAARRNGEVYGALQWSSWQLVAGAAGGETNLEALTRLEVAWRHPFAARLAAKDRPLTAMRSAWTITESALALPKDKALAELARRVLDKVGTQAAASVAALEKAPNDKQACLAALYGYLALRNGEALGHLPAERLAGLRGGLKKYLANDPGKQDPLRRLRTIGKILVQGLGKSDGKEITSLFDAGVRSDDLNALGALAARKAGGDTWRAFRASARDNFAGNGVSGAVVLIANRIGKVRLPSAR